MACQKSERQHMNRATPKVFFLPRTCVGLAMVMVPQTWKLELCGVAVAVHWKPERFWVAFTGISNVAGHVLSSVLCAKRARACVRACAHVRWRAKVAKS